MGRPLDPGRGHRHRGPRPDLVVVDAARRPPARPARDPLHRHPRVRRSQLDHRRADRHRRRTPRRARRSARPVLGDGRIPDVGDLRERRLAPDRQLARRGDGRGEPDGGDRSAAACGSHRCRADHARRRPVRRRHRRRDRRRRPARGALRPELGPQRRRRRHRCPPIVRHQHRLRRRRAGCRGTPVRHPDRAGAPHRTPGRAVGRSDLHRIEDPGPAGASSPFVRRGRDPDRVAGGRGCTRATTVRRVRRHGIRGGDAVIRRAIPALVFVILGLTALFVVGRDTPTADPATFALQSGSWMPHVNDTDKLTGSWFCPGVPASGEEGVGGEVVVSNRAGDQLVGRFSVLTPDGVAATQDFTVEPWSRNTIDVSALATAPFVSVVVELDGGGGLVEQRALHPAGNSVAPCSNDTSDTWYLADGFTVDGSVESLILSNPYDDVAIAQLTFATESGESSPSAFRGFPIPPRSVKVIPLADPALGVQDEPVIAVEVTTTTGRIVLGRAQHYLGGGRLGYEVTLAAPAPRDQYWFADGEQGDGITETYAIYNPTDADVEVDAVFLGLPVEANFGGIPTITVPSRRVVVFDPTDEQYAGTVPDGRHAVVFSTLAEPSIVVERALTRPADDSVATSVLLGAPPREDGFVATQWHLGIGPSDPTTAALVVYNVDNVDGTVTVEAVGPGGPTAIEGLSDIPIGPGAVLTIDLTAPDALNRELILTASNRVFVERSLSRGGDLSGRSSSWAVPSSASS